MVSGYLSADLLLNQTKGVSGLGSLYDPSARWAGGGVMRFEGPERPSLCSCSGADVVALTCSFMSAPWVLEARRSPVITRDPKSP